MNVKSRASKGFTLTEVLVALTVAVLLVAILIPVLSSVRANALETSCASAANQNGLAVLMYAQDNDATFVYQDQGNVQVNNGKGRGGAIVDNWRHTRKPNWAAESAPYTRSKTVGTCPANQGWADGVDSAEEPLTYIMNGWISGRAQVEATTPATLVMLYDGRYEASWATANPVADMPHGRGNGNGNGGGNGGGNGNGGGKGRGHVVHDSDGNTFADIWNLTTAPPHRTDGDQGRYNVVFLDGHCTSMDSRLFQSHAQYDKHAPPKGIWPPVPENHFAF